MMAKADVRGRLFRHTLTRDRNTDTLVNVSILSITSRRISIKTADLYDWSSDLISTSMSPTRHETIGARLKVEFWSVCVSVCMSVCMQGGAGGSDDVAFWLARMKKSSMSKANRP